MDKGFAVRSRTSWLLAAWLVGLVAVIGVYYALTNSLPQDSWSVEFILLTDDPSRNDRRLELENSAVERLTKQCMQEQSLPYVISGPRPAPTLAGVGALAAWEFAERYGFGITTDPPPDLVDIPDPNRAYADTLPPAEKQVYIDALYGTGPGNPGCIARAQVAVFGLRQAALDRARPVLDDLERRTRADQRLVGASSNWTECLSAATGFPILRRDLQSFVTQMFAGGLATLEAMPTEERSAALSSLQAQERAFAIAVVECDQRLKVDEQPILREIHAAWISDNRTALERLRADLLAVDAMLERGDVSFPPDG